MSRPGERRPPGVALPLVMTAAALIWGVLMLAIGLAIGMMS